MGIFLAASLRPQGSAGCNELTGAGAEALTITRLQRWFFRTEERAVKLTWLVPGSTRPIHGGLSIGRCREGHAYPDRGAEVA